MSVVSVYRALLALYPRDYLASFRREMLSAFEKAGDERRAEGWPAYARFAAGELAGLALGATTEWIAKCTTNSAVRGRSVQDLRKMRPAGVTRELWFAAAGGNAPANELTEAEKRTEFLVNRVVHAIANHDFEGARTYCYEETKAREKLRLLREKYGTGQ
jgi:hypothetical protein